MTVESSGCAAASRGCGRVGISISSPPTPMPAMSRSVTFMPAISAVEHPVEAIFLGAARAARRADDRLSGKLAEHQQIAGIDRHAGADDRRRPPARMAAGITSSKSLIADAPKITTMIVRVASDVGGGGDRLRVVRVRAPPSRAGCPSAPAALR